MLSFHILHAFLPTQPYVLPPFKKKTTHSQLGLMVYTFNISTQESEANGYLSSKLAWSTEGVPEPPRETCFKK